MKKNALPKQSKTDWAHIDAMKDEDIDYSDIPPLTDDFFKKAVIRWPSEKERITISLDKDILSYLRTLGKGYQTKINTILRAWFQVQVNPKKAKTS